MDRYTTPEPLAAPFFEGQPAPYRVDLELEGVDTFQDTYEGRVYIDNPDADATTGRDPDAGYAGSFYMFGHSNCLGAEGHCDVDKGPPINPYDYRRPHDLAGQTHKIEITDALLRTGASAGSTFTVTIVPLINTPEDPYVQADVLSFERLSVIAYDAVASVALAADAPA
jgi:hypothetical protein